MCRICKIQSRFPVYPSQNELLLLKKRSSYKTAPSVNNLIKRKNIPYLECLSHKNAEPDSLHLPYILMRLSAIYFAETIITLYLLFVKLIPLFTKGSMRYHDCQKSQIHLHYIVYTSTF